MDLLSLGKEPINPGQPAGTDVRYEPEFEELQAEIDKLSSPSAESPVDWKEVVEFSSSILAEKSKDILVASYLAVALIHTRQIEGLAIGLRVLSGLMAEFWENLYPSKKRMRGRAGAIDWWLEKSTIALDELKATPVPPEQLEQLTEDLGRVEQLLKQRFDEPHSVEPLRKFIKKVSELSKEKPEEKAPPPQEEKVQPITTPEPKPEKPPPSAPPAETEDITSEKEAQRQLRLGLQKIQQVAVYLNENEPMNPLSYRCTRVAAWSTAKSLPPVVNGKTKIPPPPPQVVKVLYDLRQKGDWEALVKAAELRLSRFIFWLDVNRFAAEALVNLGGGYQEAHDVVCRETAFLVHRLSGLDGLSFSDGMPFADPETKQWLKSIEFGTSTIIDEPTFTVDLGVTDADKDQMAETIQKAQALAREKKFMEAVESLQEELRKSSSKKKTLQWRLALSQILMSSKQANLAVPHFEKVLEDIELYRLEEWDPDLALEGFKLIWVGFNNQTDKTFKKKAMDVLNRIARLNTTEALRLENRGRGKLT